MGPRPEESVRTVLCNLQPLCMHFERAVCRPSVFGFARRSKTPKRDEEKVNTIINLNNNLRLYIGSKRSPLCKCIKITITTS